MADTAQCEAPNNEMSYPQRRSIDIWNLSVQDLPVYADWQGNKIDDRIQVCCTHLFYQKSETSNECKFPVGVNLILN